LTTGVILKAWCQGKSYLAPVLWVSGNAAGNRHRRRFHVCMIRP
jgi:hypothetical protein